MKFSNYLPYTVLLLILSLVVWAAWYIYQPQNFPIRVVQVEGEFVHLAKSQLQQQALPYVNKSFFALQTDKLRQRLEQLPWVARATVSREWPDKVVIYVTEISPLAKWNDAGVIGTNGVVFYPEAASIPRNLPTFKAQDDIAPMVFARYQEFAAVLHKLGVEIKALNVAENQSWTLLLSNDMQVELGRVRMTERLERFVRSYQQVFGANGSHAERVDLRYDNGIAVKWRQEII